MAILISTEEVCELLSIKPNNLHQMVYRKQLTWVGKSGKRLVFDREQVEAFKAKREGKKNG